MSNFPRISFVLASCQYPAGMLDRHVAEASYRRLARLLDARPQRERPKCLILTGDQIYVDATAGLFDPTTEYDRFSRPHQRLFREGGPLAQVTPRMPIYALMDDHEIEDNWEPIAGDGKDAEEAQKALETGRNAFLRLQRTGLRRDRNAPEVRLWFAEGKVIDDFPFFLADTRTEREPRSAETVDAARIMSKDQFDALACWLTRQPAAQPKFVASPAILVPRRRRAMQSPPSALRSDAWDGYPSSLSDLLQYILEKQIPNIVFLSGDEHISCVARATLSAPPTSELKPVVIHSIHSSSLYAPFPFANSIAEDLAAEDSFSFGSLYSCTVTTEFVPGDGFAEVTVCQTAAGWQMSCRFDRERSSPPVIELPLSPSGPSAAISSRTAA